MEQARELRRAPELSAALPETFACDHKSIPPTAEQAAFETPHEGSEIEAIEHALFGTLPWHN